jgi:hypothetical protein
MTFRIRGLSPEPFQPLFGLPDHALRTHGAVRHVVDAPAGFPDRVEMRDCAPGETVLLLNYVHQPADTPYRSSHAIFVREGATRAYDAVGVVPEVLRTRLLSVRAFDARHLMADADVVEGSALAALVDRMLARPDVAYLHAHTARRGCYLGRSERVA